MTALTIDRAIQATQQTTTSTTFVDVTGTPVTPSAADTDYLVICTAQFGLANASNECELQLVYGSTPTVFPAAFAQKIPLTTTDANKTNYGYAWLWNSGAGPDVVKLQFRTPSGSTARVDSISVILIPLADLTLDTDYFFNADDDSGAPTGLTTTWVDFATITFEGVSGDDYWILGMESNEVVDLNSGRKLLTRIRRDGTATAPTATYFEGARTGVLDANDADYVSLYSLVWPGDGASHTFAMQAAEESGTPAHTHVGSFIIALDLNVFDVHGYVQTVGEITVDSPGTPEVSDTFDVEPNVTGDYVIFGAAVADLAADGNRAKVYVDAAGAEIITGHSANFDAESGNGFGSGGTTQEHLAAMASVVELATGAARTINLNVDHSGATDALEDRVLVAFSAEVATQDVTVDVPVAALTLTGFAPQVNITVAVPVASLTLTGFAPTVSVEQTLFEVPTAALTLTGLAPSVIIGTVIEIPTASLTLTGQTPNLIFGPLSITVPVASLTLTGFAPTVTTALLPIEVPTATLILTGMPPNVTHDGTVLSTTFTLDSEQEESLTLGI